METRTNISKSFYRDLYAIKGIYSEIIEILESFFSGDLLIFDDSLNKLYLFDWAELEKLTHKHPDTFKEIIKVGKPIEAISPANITDQDYPESEWDHGIKEKVYKINDLLEQEWIKHAKFLSPINDLEDINPKTSNIISHYKLHKSQQEDGWVKEMALKGNQFGLSPKDLNLLRFHIESGDVEYRASSGKKYTAHFGKTTNSYKLLSFLVENPRKIFQVEELVKKLNKPTRRADSPTDDRRVRDTVQSIRDSFQIDEGYDFFLVNNGFGLNCIVDIRR